METALESRALLAIVKALIDLDRIIPGLIQPLTATDLRQVGKQLEAEIDTRLLHTVHVSVQ